MGLGFTQEQTMSGESLTRTLERSHGPAALFELGAGAAPMTEEAGGLGGTGPDSLMMFRTLSRGAAVTPLLDSVVLGVRILAAAGEPDLAKSATRGKAGVAVALNEPGQRDDGIVRTSAAGDRLTGEKSDVTGAKGATQLIVLAVDGLYPVKAAAKGLSVRGYVLRDGACAAEVTLTDVPARRIGDAPLLDRPLAAAILAVCAGAPGGDGEGRSLGDGPGKGPGDDDDAHSSSA